MRFYIIIILFSTFITIGKSVLYLSSPTKEYIEIAKVIAVSQTGNETQVLLACDHGIWGMWGVYDKIKVGQEIEVYFTFGENGTIIHKVKNWHVSKKKDVHGG